MNKSNGDILLNRRIILLHKECFRNTGEKMKKIAVIANIRSNLYALEKFMKEISDSQIEYIFNLGNFFDSDLFCCEIFDLITSDTKFINVLGYRERSMLRIMENPATDDFMEEEIDILSSIINTLGEERVNKLKQFHKEVEIVCEGRRIYAGADTTSMDCVDYGCAEEKIAIMLLRKGICDRNDFFRYDYVLYGYHGLSEMEYFLEPVRKDRETCYISPGNLYMHRRGKIQFTIIQLGKSKDMVQQNNVTVNQDKIIQEIKRYNSQSFQELRKYGELNYMDKTSGDLVIKCRISEPFQFHCKYRKQYIELWKKMIDFCDKECVRYYISNIKDGIPEDYEQDWTSEEKKKVKEEFIGEDGQFAWHEMGLLDKDGKILFSSSEFGTVYWLNHLDETQTSEILEYLNALPNSREMVSYELY